jgi:DNA-binding response OmpR family regulator
VIDQLSGKKILVVEDDYLITEVLIEFLTAAGAEVVGPVANVRDAIDAANSAQHLDAAIVDLHLRGEVARPVIDALVARGIKVVISTGLPDSELSATYAKCVVRVKPLSLAELLEDLKA